MARPLRKYTTQAPPEGMGTVVPLTPRSESLELVSTSADRKRQRAADADLVAAVRSYLEWVQPHAVNVYEGLKKRWGTPRVRIGEKLRRMREERPLQLLGEMMGIAFATGLALRVWRTSHNE